MGSLSIWYEVTLVTDSRPEAEKLAKTISKNYKTCCFVVEGSSSPIHGADREVVSEFKPLTWTKPGEA